MTPRWTPLLLTAALGLGLITVHAPAAEARGKRLTGFGRVRPLQPRREPGSRRQGRRQQQTRPLDSRPDFSSGSWYQEFNPDSWRYEFSPGSWYQEFSPGSWQQEFRF